MFANDIEVFLSCITFMMFIARLIGYALTSDEYIHMILKVSFYGVGLFSLVITASIGIVELMGFVL